MEAKVFLQKILWLCCRSWDRHSAGHLNEPIIQGTQTYRLVRTATVFPMFCSTPVMSGQKHLHLQILTHYGYCEAGDSTLFNASQTGQLWKSDPWAHTSILVLSQMMPRWCTTLISELRKNWNFLIPLGKWVWDRHSPHWKVDGSCCHAVNWCCPYWFGPHLSVPSSLLQSPRFLWEHMWSGFWVPLQFVLAVSSQLSSAYRRITEFKVTIALN